MDHKRSINKTLRPTLILSEFNRDFPRPRLPLPSFSMPYSLLPLLSTSKRCFGLSLVRFRSRKGDQKQEGCAAAKGRLQIFKRVLKILQIRSRSDFWRCDREEEDLQIQPKWIPVEARRLRG